MTAPLPAPIEETPVPTDAPLVLPFTDPRCQEVELTGGKGASLATMTAEGLPVPPGFVITSAAFAAAVDEEALREAMRRKDVEAARELVAAAVPPKELIEAEFATLRAALQVSDSVLSKHLSALADAGYVRSRKGVQAGQRTTWIALTSAGREALRERVAALRRLIDMVD